jgi:hypothetical protein
MEKAVAKGIKRNGKSHDLDFTWEAAKVPE